MLTIYNITMISYSIQQGIAYALLCILVVCIACCILNVLYNLLVYIFTRTGVPTDLDTMHFTDTLV